MTQGTLTGNVIQGTYAPFRASDKKRFKIAGLHSSDPVEVWKSAKMKCANWDMVAGVAFAAIVSAAGWAGVGYLISHLLG